jgi:hypothetical protein
MRALLAVVALVLVGLCVWLLRAEPEAADAGVPLATRPATGAQASVELRAAVATTSVPAAEPARTVAFDADATRPAGPSPTLVVARVTAVETGAPLEHVHVSA